MGSSLAKFPKSRELVPVTPLNETAKHPFVLLSLLLGTGHCQFTVLSRILHSSPLFHLLSLLQLEGMGGGKRSAPHHFKYTIFNSVLLCDICIRETKILLIHQVKNLDSCLIFPCAITLWFHCNRNISLLVLFVIAMQLQMRYKTRWMTRYMHSVRLLREIRLDAIGSLVTN